MKPLGYVLFVLPPLKRNITDKEEFKFEVICFVFLSIIWEYKVVNDERIGKWALHVA
jgi:hypothetical protein